MALNLIEGIGPVRVRVLLDHFGDAPTVLRASRQQLMQVRGIGEESADAIANWEKTIALDAELKRIADFGCRIVAQQDEEYPHCCGRFTTRRPCSTSKAKCCPRTRTQWRW